MIRVKTTSAVFLTRTLGLVALLALPPVADASPIQWNTGPGNNGHWYEVLLAPDGITWDDAQADALAMGGYLATILSAEENAFVFGLIDSASYWTLESAAGSAEIGPWIGGFQPSGSAEPGGGWTWVNGDGLFSYVNWASTEPSNGVGSAHGLPESRLHYFTYGGRGSTWNDYPDTFAVPIAYVVEYDRIDATPVPEPASLLLCLVGLGAGRLARMRRRP